MNKVCDNTATIATKTTNYEALFKNWTYWKPLCTCGAIRIELLYFTTEHYELWCYLCAVFAWQWHVICFVFGANWCIVCYCMSTMFERFNFYKLVKCHTPSLFVYFNFYICKITQARELTLVQNQNKNRTQLGTNNKSTREDQCHTGLTEPTIFFPYLLFKIRWRPSNWKH